MNVQDIANRIFSGYRQKNTPYLVAIDGMSCSGKTTLADRLAEILKSDDVCVLRPSIDGFHNPKEIRYRQGEYSAQGYYEDCFDYTAVISQLLRPLQNGPWPAECSRASFNLRANMPLEEKVTAPQNTILLFDGLSLMRPELNAYWDFRILLKISYEEAIRRALARDLELLGSAENVEKKYRLRYNPAWGMYQDRENPEAMADLVIEKNAGLPATPRNKLCFAPVLPAS